MRRVVLASGSPRRVELLRLVGIDVDIRPQGVDERRDPADRPVRHAARLAERKTDAALNSALHGEVIIAADTVVHLGDDVLDKPTDRDEAISHLRRLSGREHLVTTGVCVADAPPTAAFTVTTRVRFRALTEAEIAAYVWTGEADDKAGAYAIQGRGGSLVAEVHGSWTNVMGLPLEECLRALAALGVVR